jgi:type I restriction enzyme S subunit
MSWPTKKLGNLVSIKGGGTPSKKIEEYWNGNIPWASVKDLKSRLLLGTLDSITPLGVEKSATNIIPKGTIIVPTRMALGKVAVAGVDLAINQDLKALIIKDEEVLNKDYLSRFLESKAKYMESEGKGATVKGITLDFLKGLDVPLPPLEEQKRIAAILDKADAIRQKRKQAIDLADEFLRSVFLDMFGDPVTNPKGWEKKPLVELATQDKRAIVDGPFGASLKTDEYVESGVPVIRINNICERKFVNENFKYITEEKYEELKRSSVEKNDVLVARVGHTIGKACVFDQKFKALLSTTGVCKITCEQSKIHHGFLEALWANGSFQKYIKGFAKGAGQPYYNLTTIKAFEIIKPPLELQHRYIELSQQVAFAVDRAECSYEQLENIFQSLNQKAFSGQL